MWMAVTDQRAAPPEKVYRRISALQRDPGRATAMPSFVTQAPTTESLTSLCYDVGLAL